VNVRGVHHVAIKAADVERTAAFYRDVLGLSPLARHEEPDGALRSLWLGAQGVIVMIERSRTPARGGAPAFAVDPPGLHLVAFAIPASERQAWRDRVEKAGHPIVHETRFTLYTLDPEGNRVGLSSYPDPGA
jgi:glyoxylase I family protein